MAASARTADDKECEYCGTTFAVPWGAYAVVERTCDALPPARVVVWGFPPGSDPVNWRWGSGAPPVLHACRKGVPD